MRHLALLMSERDPSQTRESWKRTLNRYLDEDAAKPTVPSVETARLLSQLLEKPDDYFVRPQQRETMRDERDRLLREVAELRQALAAQRAAGGSSA